MKQPNRGSGETIKIRARDEFELVAFRHAELRRVPNPDPVRLKFYEPTIASACANFYRRCKNLCDDSMYQIDDLKSFAYVWAINYIGLYQLSSDEGDQNLKLLRTYLNQRFNELRKLLWKKNRNVLIHYDEAAIVLTGTVFNEIPLRQRKAQLLNPEDFSNIVDFISVPESQPLDQAYLNRHRGYETNSVEKRKENASKALEEGLAKLGHDKMLEVLIEARDNVRVHPDAQKHAGKKLREHTENCEQCRSLEVNKEMSGIEQGSV